MRAAKHISSRCRRRKRARNVAESVPRCQPRLRLRVPRSCQHGVPHRHAPVRRERCRESLTLIESALALPFGRQRHRNDRAPLFEHIARPVEAGHSRCHTRGDCVPPLVLECVHHAQPDAVGGPAHAAGRANERWKQVAPAALLTVCGVAAAIASRRGEPWESGPASAADETRLISIKEPLAHHATAREHQVGDCAYGGYRYFNRVSC
jgi:hypothetical protein